MTGTLVPAGATPHLVVDDLAHPSLDPAAEHHLRRVRRTRDGATVTVTDGRGRWRTTVFAGGALEPTGEVVSAIRRGPEVTVAFALTKADKPELVIQKLTELGVDRIVPFVAERSVVVWEPAKADKHVERWRAIARAAVEQSHGCWLPAVGDLATVGDLAAGAGPARTPVRLDRGGAAPSLDRPCVAVGPEGGWSDGERDALPDAVGLGDTILRAETAAITIGGILTALRGGIVAPTGPKPRTDH